MTPSAPRSKDRNVTNCLPVGLTIPFDDVSLLEHRPALERLVAAGFRELWTGEVNALDGLGPLYLFAGWHEDITVTVAAASVFTRGPALLAMSAATLAEAAPGRCRFGIGAGSPVVATSWNGVQFQQPYSRVVDTLRFLREVLRGEKASDRATVHGAGFRLARPVEHPPKLLLAVAGPRMQALAAAEADSMALNFLSPSDAARIRARADGVSRDLPAPLEIAARVFVVPMAGPDPEAAARRFLTGYLTVPTYARFQEWLGRGPDLAPMNAAWQRGDRRGALELVPEQVVRDLVIFGSPAECADGVAAYLAAGVDVVTLALLPVHIRPPERLEFLEELGRELTRRTTKQP